MKNKAVKLAVAEQLDIDPADVNVEFIMYDGVWEFIARTPFGDYSFKCKLEQFKPVYED